MTVANGKKRKTKQITPKKLSNLYVLGRKSTPDKVLDDLSQFEDKVLRTSLSKEDEAKLQAALTKNREN